MMEDWTSGYVADVAYTYGYYAELNPALARLALLSAGVVPPKTMTACELGFGQGMSVNIHAAASSCTWWGTDFNPAQAGYAQELASASGGRARLFDESFEEFCRRADIPEMDFIGLHGIWSWINDGNRSIIVDFLKRKLKVGGVLYVSYNTQPGWASAVPMRDLLTEHAEVMGVPGQGIVARIDSALDFAQRLFAADARYAKANPQVVERLKKISEQDRNYVAHEYFNRDWDPMSFAKLAEWLRGAKLNFATSGNFLDHVESLNLTKEQQAIIKEIPDPMFRETVRDFCVNQQFRKDYWVRGARKMSVLEQREALDAQRVVLVKHPHEVKLQVAGSQSEGKLAEGIYNPILEALSDFQPKSLRELAAIVQPRGVNVPRLFQAVMILIGKGDVCAAQTEAETSAARETARKLNMQLIHNARGSNNAMYLASPVTGGGVFASRFQQLFLLSRLRGANTADEWARDAWQHLSASGHRLTREGKPLETPADNLAELGRFAREFQEKRLSVLDALQVI